MTRAFEEHTAADFAKYSLDALRTKRFEATLCVQAAREGIAEGDERAPEALRYYLAERAAINEALQQKQYGAEGPPAQAIGLKTLSMTGDNRRGRERPRPGVASIEEFLRMFTGGDHGRG